MEMSLPRPSLQTMVAASQGRALVDAQSNAAASSVNLHFSLPCFQDSCQQFNASLTTSSPDFEEKYENFSRLDNLFAVLAVNALLLCCTLLIVLQCKRYPILKRLYEVRLHAEEFEDLHEQPAGKPSFFPFGRKTGLWVPPHRPDLQKIIGLDGLVLLRFTTMCFNFSLAYLPVALLLVVHYALGPGEQEGLAAYQISNQGERLEPWIPILSAYYMSLTLMAFLNNEYSRLCHTRSIYLAGTATGTNIEMGCLPSDDDCTGEGLGRQVSNGSGAQADSNKNESLWEVVRHTVQVEDIPIELQTTLLLKGTFEGMFGDRSVDNSMLSVDCSELRNAVKAHRMHLQREYPKPKHAHQNRSCLEPYCPGMASFCRQQLTGMRRRLWHCMTEGYSNILRIMNVHQPSLQEREEKIRNLYFKVIRRQSSGSRVWSDVFEASPTMDSLEANMRKSSDLGRVAAHHLCPRVRRLRRMLLNLCRTLRDGARDFFRIAKGSVDETTGFVTFRSASAHAMAIQMLLQKSPNTIVATRAPFPKDIIWRNITVPDKVVTMRCYCSYPLIAIVILLWSGISSFIQALTDWKFLVKSCKTYFPSLYNVIHNELDRFPAQWMLRALQALLVGYLPVLAWLLFISVTPHFFRMWFVKVERQKQWSKIVRMSFDRYFLVQIISFYVTVFSGSFIDTNPDPLKLTQGVLTKTVSKMDSVSGYFTCLILTKLGLRGANYMLRPGPCIEWMIRYWGDVSRDEAPSGSPNSLPSQEALLEKHSNGHCDKRKSYKGCLGGWQAEKLLAEGPFMERIFTDVALSLALCMMYGIMSPIVIFAAVAYFGVVATLMRYNLLFVYIQDHDSGGEIFFSLFNKSVTSLLASLLLLQSYLMAAGTYKFKPGSTLSFVLHGALPTLMIIVIGMWHFIHRKYRPLCKTLSLEEAKKKDEAPQFQQAEGIFEDPAIKEAKHIVENKDKLDRRKLAWQDLESDFRGGWWR